MPSNAFLSPRATYDLESSSSAASSDSEQEGYSDFPNVLGRRRRTTRLQQHVLSRPTPEHAPNASPSSKSRATATQPANSKPKKPKVPLRIYTPKTSSLILALKSFSLKDSGDTSSSSSQGPSNTNSAAEVKPKKPRNKLIRASRRRNSEPVVTSVEADPSGLSDRLNHLEIAPAVQSVRLYMLEI